MSPLQGTVIDMGRVGTLSAVNASFAFPPVCLLVVTAYGLFICTRKK